MLKKYLPFFKAGAMDLLAFKFAVISWAFVSVFQVACTIFLWTSVYNNSPSLVINGFTIHEMITFQIFINIYTFVTFDNQTSDIIYHEINDGTIAMSFVKPISYRLRFVATNLGNVSILMLVFGIPFLCLSYIILGLLGFITISVNIWSFLLYILLFFIAQLLAVLLNDVICYIFGILCFYTTAGFGLNQIKMVVINFLSGTYVPISFFPGVFKTIAYYLPFAGMAQNPILILLMKVDYVEALKYIALSAIWVIILELFAKVLFNHASKKVTVQGG